MIKKKERERLTERKSEKGLQREREIVKERKGLRKDRLRKREKDRL